MNVDTHQGYRVTLQVLDYGRTFAFEAVNIAKGDLRDSSTVSGPPQHRGAQRVDIAPPPGRLGVQSRRPNQEDVDVTIRTAIATGSRAEEARMTRLDAPLLQSRGEAPSKRASHAKES